MPLRKSLSREHNPSHVTLIVVQLMSSVNLTRSKEETKTTVRELHRTHMFVVIKVKFSFVLESRNFKSHHQKAPCTKFEGNTDFFILKHKLTV